MVENHHRAERAVLHVRRVEGINHGKPVAHQVCQCHSNQFALRLVANSLSGNATSILNQARVEIKYLCSIITDLHERIKQRDVEIGIKQLRLNENEVEIQRLENMVHRAY